jgi:glycosyltransferase involved in cell wall biosynthesis
VGNLQPRKNLVTLIRGYRAALRRRPDLPERLVIVGQEWYAAERLHQETEDLRAAGRVVFTGWVDDEELVGLLQHATALAFPSIYEGFGLPPLEGMAAGVPVLVSDIPVIREVYGDAAMRLPPADPEAWGDALLRLASDPSARVGLISAGTACAARYTWQDSARSVLSALELAAASPRRDAFRRARRARAHPLR